MGDPLVAIDTHNSFKALAAQADSVVSGSEASKGGRPPYATETMVRIIVLKRLYNLSDEQMAFQLADRMSYRRFCQLTQSLKIPDRNTIGVFENRLGVACAKALFDGLDAQLSQQGYLARKGQIIDATLVRAPKVQLSKDEKAQLEQGQTPSAWSDAKRRQKDVEARWTSKHGKSYFGYKLSVRVDNK